MNFVLPLANAQAISPVLIVVLCAVAGIGTVLLMPARREAAIRTIGGSIALLGSG